MNLLKFLLPLTVVAQSFAVLTADDFSTSDVRERDSQAVQDYINTKRAVSINEKGGELKISGDIKTEYSHLNARTDGKKQRGYKSRDLYPNSAVKKGLKKLKAGFVEANKKAEKKNPYKFTKDQNWAIQDLKNKLKPPYSSNEFEVEANLVFDYIADDSWGTIKLQMGNNAGILDRERKTWIYDSRKALYGSGEENKLKLRKAFMGYNLWEQGTSRFDVEIGRRRLYDVFDSRVQFYSYFDGLLLRYTSSFEGISDFYIKGGAFVVDHTVNHFGYVGETGFLNIADSGFDLKYSLINWDRKAPNRWNKHHPLGVRFCNSQVTGYYHISPDLLRLKTQLYAAYIVNHAAKSSSWTHHRKANKGYYFGFTTGEVVRKGDYAVDVMYQHVGAQAVSERDISQMGRDNPRGISYYNRRSQGFANYKGYKIDTFYAVTDNWTLEAKYENIHQVCRAIGGKHKSTELTIAAIFAF